MDCAGNQERELIVAAVTSPSFSPVENIWADSSFPLSALPSSRREMVKCDNPEIYSLPPSTCHGMPEFIIPESCAFAPSSAGLDRTAVVNVMNPFAMRFGCLPPYLGNPVSQSNLHAVNLKNRVPSSVSLSTVEGSSFSGNTLCKSYCDVSSSRNNVAHAMWCSNPCVSKASTSRLEFMQSFVSTLLPELKSIHSQSPPSSLEEKLSAVRLAADMSLAISARGNNTWSQALFQELASSFSSKLEVRRKHNVRKTNILRGRIYASILRRSLRVGTHETHQHSRPQVCRSKGSSSPACFSRLRNCLPSTHNSAKPSNVCSASLSGGSSHAVPCQAYFHDHRMRRGRRSGQSSYVRILRQSRSTEKVASVKLLADPCNEGSKVDTPSISKEHIMSLGKLVPGGRNMDVPLLFQEAADYILSLQMQVEALQSLSHFVSL